MSEFQGTVQQNVYGKRFPKARRCSQAGEKFRSDQVTAALSSGSPVRPTTAPAL